jgi:formylglycine-generating enzyme required for sulfatase activity
MKTMPHRLSCFRFKNPFTARPCFRPQPVFFLVLAAALAATATVQADVGYEFVTVGDPVNAYDPATGSAFGGVNYTYDIGKYDVTLNQYTTFLNAVAQSDPYGLYSPSMAGDLNTAGISRTGSSGSYSYAVMGSGNRPVTYVSWFDAARFSNWLQNGQPAGLGEVASSTEQGAYTLNGATSGIILRNFVALYWIPSETEWYKAAYYDPSLNSGAGGYWTYATRSNTAPGNVVGSAANQANYNNGVYSVTQSNSYSSTQNYLTDVGAFTNSASAYGTYDQNGDVYQWNDTVVGASRGLRGGNWYNDSTFQPSSYRTSVAPTTESNGVGFRIATVPEPSVAVSLIVAGGLLLSRRKRPSALYRAS